MRFEQYIEVDGVRIDVELIYSSNPLKIEAIVVHGQKDKNVQMFAPVDEVKKWRRR